MKKNVMLLSCAALLALALAGCSQSTAQADYIGTDAAKAIALEAAGIGEADATFTTAELETRNNTPYYEVDFTAGGQEYDYDIDALTGTVIAGNQQAAGSTGSHGGSTGDTAITADKATAQEGDTVTLTVRPAEGYVLQSLTATCAAAAPGTVPLQEKGEGIYTFAMPAGDVTVTGTFALEEEEEEPWPPFPFTDVPETMWYYDSVYYVYAHGLMNGTAATLFSPGNPTTRGMLVTILYRMEGSPQGAGWGPFTDVTPGAYYAQPIAWAAWNGIVNGITSTTFAPDRNVTREQMAAILYRYTAWKEWEVSHS